MKYFFFSDLHICDGTFKDDFSQNFTQDMKFMDKIHLIKQKVDKIVGVGDIFELWQASHNEIMNAHYIVMRFILDHVKLLKGNHDFDMFTPQTMRFATKSGKRCMASHGFQNNEHMRKWYVKAGIYIVGKLEKFFPWLDNKDKHPKLYKLLPGKWRGVFQKKRDKIQGIRKDVEEYCKSFIGKLDIVFVGHSHYQEAKTLTNDKGSILMLNAGHNTGGQFQGILFDTATDKHVLI